MQYSPIRRFWLKLCRAYGLHKPLARVLPAPGGNKKWVFIVGCYNSGTTLLNELLGTHPSISILPYEGVALASMLLRPEELGWPRMWHKCLDRLGPSSEQACTAALRTQREWGLCFDPRKPVNVEKSIVNAARVPWLIEYFQPAWFIHIVRNGYAVAEGIRRRTAGRAPGGGDYALADCAMQWVVTNRRLRADLAGYENRMGLTYEELVLDTPAVLARIAGFIGLDAADFPAIDELRVHGKISQVSNRNAQSLARLSDTERHEIESVAQAELAYYGHGIN